MEDPDRQIWSDVLAHLRRHHPTLCRQWFERLEPLGVAEGSFHLRTSHPVHGDYLRRQCLEEFNDAVRTVTGRLVTVRFLDQDEPAPDIERQPEGRRSGRSGSRSAKAPSRRERAQFIEPFIEPRLVDPPASANGHAPLGAGPGSHAASRPGDEAGSTNKAAASIEAKPAAIDHRTTDHAGIDNGAPAAPLHHHGEQDRRHTIAGRTAPPRPPHASSESRRVTPRISDDSLVINPDYAFEHFVVGPNNRLAHAASVAVAGNPGKAYNPLFIHGGVGLGKTHLLQAICLHIAEQNPGAVMAYLSCDGFVNHFMEHVQAGNMAEFRNRFREVDLLVIDDIHFLAKRERMQEEFFHTFNSLFQANKQIVLSSDAAPQEIPDLEDRLVSRFAWGLVTDVQPPCFDTRVAILRSKAQIRGMELPDDAACFIAERIDSNIRELEGAIGRVQLRSAVECRDVDLALVKEALGVEPEAASAPPSIHAIISAVTAFYGVKLTDLQSKRRNRSVAQPRQVCMYLARRLTRLSLEEIGGYFGGRDHSTVLHAVRTTGQRRDGDPEFARVLEQLEAGASGPNGRRQG